MLTELDETSVDTETIMGAASLEVLLPEHAKVRNTTSAAGAGGATAALGANEC